MPRRWAIRLAMDGDLRFLSHHDMMRLVRRAAERASLPLRYTQGFNPHPIFSLACPRPVSVASADDLLVVTLEEAGPSGEAGAGPEPAELLERLNRQTPHGLRCLEAWELPGKRCPRPAAATYATPVPPEKLPDVRRRLEELAGQAAWTVDRKTSAGRGGRGWAVRQIDIRPLVRDLRLDGETLRMTLDNQGDLWARPSEVLVLLGLDERLDLARTVRTAVEYES